MKEQTSHRECSEKQAEQDVSGVGSVLRDVNAFGYRQTGHNDHENEIEHFIHRCPLNLRFDT